MAQWVRVLAAVPEDQSVIPRTHTRGLTITLNSRFRKSDALF